jgi:fermentation-respiration switch protein FrsA (DUF1100 family)
LQVPSELNSPLNAAKIRAPALFILADDDDFVIPANQRKVVDAYAGPKKEIHMSGGHNDTVSGEAEKELQKGIDWLWQTIAPPARAVKSL